MISLNNNILNNDEILTPINRIKINNNQIIIFMLYQVLKPILDILVYT